MKTPKEWHEEFSHRCVAEPDQAAITRTILRNYAEIQEDALLALMRVLPIPSKRPDTWNQGYDQACRHMHENMRRVIEAHLARVRVGQAPIAATNKGTG